MADRISKSQPRLPLLTRFKFGLLALAMLVSTRSDGTINRRLFNLIDIKTSAPSTKLISELTRPAILVPSTITPSHKSLPLIVYFHGGGFRSYGLDTKSFDDLCSHLAAKVPAVVASINYRLTPEHKYPSQYEDGFDAIKFIDAQTTASLPACTDLSRCFIGGDSAGANIAHHVTIRALQNAEQLNKIRIVGVVSLQPFFGGVERTESELRLTRAPVIDVKRTDVMWRDFLPEGADRNHLAAHVFGGGANSEAGVELKNLDFPSILVFMGGSDPLQDWQRRYVEWLKDCGKEVEVTEYANAFHGLPEFAFLIDKVANFVQKQAHSY